MRRFVTGLFVISILWFFGLIVDAVVADYQYDNEIGSYWELGVKASTLPKKAEYLDKFVSALEKANLADSSALWLKTPDASVEQNMTALHSLQERMHEIQGMDVSSFQYQQAMAQITGQEQDEAKKMLDVFRDAWYMNHHFFLWDWMAPVSFVGAILVCLILGVGTFSSEVWE